MIGTTINNQAPNLVWILEDNLLVLSIVKNAISKRNPNVRIVGYSSYYDAALDLCRIKSADYPDKLIVDYDFGEEGNIEYFLGFISFLDNNEKFDVILHSDTPEIQLQNALSSPVVKKFIPKSTDLLPLFNAIGLG